MTELETTSFGTVSLGELIKALKCRDGDQTVRFDFAYFAPKGLDSYRGFYDHLAFGYESGATITVVEVLNMLENAVGKNFRGYKGGNFQMHVGTPVWVANNGEATSTAIVDIADCDYMTILETRRVEV